LPISPHSEKKYKGSSLNNQQHWLNPIWVLLRTQLRLGAPPGEISNSGLFHQTKMNIRFYSYAIPLLFGPQKGFHFIFSFLKLLGIDGWTSKARIVGGLMYLCGCEDDGASRNLWWLGV
jgi:hypothetical protein